jgi:hypothetical protein
MNNLGSRRAPNPNPDSPDFVVQLDPQWLEFWTGAIMAGLALALICVIVFVLFLRD